MKNKLMLILLIGMFLISFISANDLKISIIPHYYKYGQEILATPEIQYSAISFEIIGENSNPKFRVLNLSIIDSYPIAFKEALPFDMKEDLRILQTKTLWTSKLIDVKDLIQNNQTNISLWVGVNGIKEETGEEIYVKGHLNFTINKLEEEKPGILYSAGKTVWDSNPTGGLLVILVAIFGVGFYFWKYEGGDKLNKWRENSKRRRINRRRYDEGW